MFSTRPLMGFGCILISKMLGASGSLNGMRYYRICTSLENFQNCCYGVGGMEAGGLSQLGRHGVSTPHRWHHRAKQGPLSAASVSQAQEGEGRGGRALISLAPRTQGSEL